MREAEIKALLFDPVSHAPVVFLKDRHSTQTILIQIGEAEAISIAHELQDKEFVRPLSHDLMKTMINTLDGSVEKIVIDSIKENIFYATIFLRKQNGEIKELDARPSDSLALAVRMSVPIYVNEDVFAAVAFESPFSDDDEFQDFIEQKMNLAEFKKFVRREDINR
ncbi:bifunctional nuclease family protein [Candidatus Acetothermia bacterium]|jgi:bifunctional DNase/RNase|nr:bifunctional nuclease family protein [Candidatus Acetothermia bacterium]MCI2427411.1 bifunctional nuclease family protein [Candidatus Acetothermia bacterium]MCI2428566.1 bifunctional nuclease family protein [Candidatus Acetothermia bacterium]